MLRVLTIVLTALILFAPQVQTAHADETSDALNAAVSTRLIVYRILGPDFFIGRLYPQLEIRVEWQNKSDTTIDAAAAYMFWADGFGTEIAHGRMTIERPLAPGATRTQNYIYDILPDTPMQAMLAQGFSLTWWQEPWTVVWSDGRRVSR